MYSSADGYYVCAFKDGISLGCVDGCDGAVTLGKDVVFHLHGLYDGHFLAACDGLAFLDVDADDDAGKRALDGLSRARRGAASAAAGDTSAGAEGPFVISTGAEGAAEKSPSDNST